MRLLHVLPSIAFLFLSVHATAQSVLVPTAKEHLGAAHPPNLMPEVIDHHFADMDGDGDRDLVRADTVARIFANVGGGRFTPGQAFSSTIRRQAVGDVNGDGYPDVVTCAGTRFYGNTGGRIDVAFNQAGVLLAGVSISSTTVAADCMLLEDIDGDTDLDLFVGGDVPTSSSGWLLFENDGSGQFTDVTRSIVASPFLTRFAEIEDFDGDGDRDILVAQNGRTGTGSKILVNDGQGHFQDPPGGPFTSETVQCVIDVDGDGDADAIGSHSVWFNEGGLVFRQGGSIGAYANGLDAVDLDLDGDVDLVYLQRDRLQIELNDGSGAFTNVTATWLPAHLQGAPASAAWFYAGSVACDDVDGDGDPDVVFGAGIQPGTGSFTVGTPPRLLLNDGGRRLVDGNRAAFPHQERNSSSVVAGDVDGDGDIDLIVGNHALRAGVPDANQLFLNDGHGQFTERTSCLPPRTNSFGVAANDLALVDLDGDADVDLIEARGGVASPLSGRNEIALNDGTGCFQDASAGMPPLSANSTSVAWGDVDGDGIVDLVFGNGDVGTPEPNHLLLGNGNGSFTDVTALRLPNVADATVDVALGDLDGDGDLDLVVANVPRPRTTSQPGLRILRNDGSGTFVDETPGRVPYVDELWNVVLHDEDDDGDLDILAPGTETWWNDGTARFHGPSQTTTRAYDLTIADIAGDGSMTRVWGSDELVIGNQNVPWGGNVNIRGVASADFDGDGDPDVAMVCAAQFGYEDAAWVPNAVFCNHRQQLQSPYVPSIGKPYRFELHAEDPATYGLIVLSAWPLHRPVWIADVGTWHLDPAGSVLLDPTTIGSANIAHVTVELPQEPLAIGLVVHAQALFLDGALRLRSSNWLAETIVE